MVVEDLVGSGSRLVAVDSADVMGDFAIGEINPDEEVIGGLDKGDFAKASSNPLDEDEDDLDGRSTVVAEDIDFVRSGAPT